MALMQPRFILTDITMGVDQSNVVFAVDSLTGEDCVGKIFDLEDQEDVTLFSNEIQLLGSSALLNSSYIVDMRSSYLQDTWGVIILEKMESDILEYILANSVSTIRKREIFVQCCIALKVCHDLGIAHMDVKPENFLQSNHCEAIKLADFGSSQKVEESSSPGQTTLQYRAPELFSVLSDVDRRKADIWSLGIFYHVLMTQSWPFTNPEPVSIKHSILNNKLAFDPSLNPEDLQLIQTLLNPNPLSRPSIDALLEMVQCPNTHPVPLSRGRGRNSLRVSGENVFRKMKKSLSFSPTRRGSFCELRPSC